ncbi:hypothetical protein PENSPDRAFT_211478 [Peniophora sp. CONT]|nr:hypothetical protein PENSPDRAFT_211478 [Peniophora sp. CONT]
MNGINGNQGNNNTSTPAWPNQLATALGAIGEQLIVTSRDITQASSSSISAAPVAGPSYADLNSILTRLAAIEEGQALLRKDVQDLKSYGSAGPSSAAVSQPASTGDLEKRIEELQEALRLSQEQLYARLHNARATTNKSTIMAPVTAAGAKPPAGFPATRGEFEHLTRERYEAILKAYNVPLRGDTAAKKEAARKTLGIPSGEPASK